MLRSCLMTDESSASIAAPVEETVRRKRAAADKRPQRQPRYHVLLWNDDDHSYDYVISMVKDLFGATDEAGFKIAEEVDAQGRAVVLTTTREHAELKRDQIHAYGKDDRIVG